MTGAQYLLNRIAELEGAVATLLDQKAAIEKERDVLKARPEGSPAEKTKEEFTKAVLKQRAAVEKDCEEMRRASGPDA